MKKIFVGAVTFFCWKGQQLCTFNVLLHLNAYNETVVHQHPINIYIHHSSIITRSNISQIFVFWHCYPLYLFPNPGADLYAFQKHSPRLANQTITRSTLVTPWSNRNILWLRDAVRQTSRGKSAAAGRPTAGRPRPLTSRGMSAWPYRVTTKYSFYPVHPFKMLNKI